MSFPSNLDSFLGTTAQGTSPLSSPDHAQDHRTLGSASYALEQKIGIGVSSPTAGKILISTGSGTTSWGTVWNNGVLGSPAITGGLVGGTANFTAGTVTGALLGTNTYTGGTISSILITRRSIGYASYNGTIGGTTTLDLSTATRFLVDLPSGTVGNVTLAVSNVVVNQPFIVEIRQGVAGAKGTIQWFSQINWPDQFVPILSASSYKDTFGFIPIGTVNFNGYIIGQNL